MDFPASAASSSSRQVHFSQRTTFTPPSPPFFAASAPATVGSWDLAGRGDFPPLHFVHMDFPALAASLSSGEVHFSQRTTFTPPSPPFFAASASATVSSSRV